ncbi:hypothetical protein [Vibrio parahaemolyticus]|uniref:hypothetical protein n=1 Tax=Vibrio parahaemolyticus TaxID=670 RepID=UPI0011243110|nr:hypothetical protein [Vibrio parahaemolyticus]TOJ30676.1 hypothetical protein CGI43_03280 [Vibrio parahaemolyticus]
MKVAVASSSTIINETSGVNTFIHHLRTCLEKHDHELEVTTEERNYQHGCDIYIANDAYSFAFANGKNIINVNHMGDVLGVMHTPDKVDYPREYIFDYLNKQVSFEGTNVSLHNSFKAGLTKLGIETDVIPLPFYPSEYTVPEHKDGIIIVGAGWPRKQLHKAIELIPADIPVTLLSSAELNLPDNWTQKVLPNSQVTNEIAKHKILFLPSCIEVYPYVLLESVAVTRAVVMPHFWNEGLPYDKVSSTSELVALYDQGYEPPFDIYDYSLKAENAWLDLLTNLV